MLLSHFQTELLPEAGCDEAGRGCLAGPVFAAAVVFAPDYVNAALNDSKQLTARRRYRLREEIERDALAWAVASASSAPTSAPCAAQAASAAKRRRGMRLFMVISL